MAKIYETLQDVERDIIADKIKNAHESKKIFAGLAATSGLLSVLYFRVHELSEELLSQSRDVKNLVLGNDHVKGWIAALGVVASAGMTFAFQREEHKLKKKAEELGRENVISPKHEIVKANDSADLYNQHVARLENSKKILGQGSVTR